MSPAPPARGAGIALVAVSAAAFGAMAIFARAAYADGADVTAVLWLRFTIAAACMAAIVRLRGGRWPRGRLLAGLAALGGVGYVGQSLSYFTALTLAPASLVALLLYLYPAIVVVLGVVLLGDRLSRAKVLALALALGGAGLTIAPGLAAGAGAVRPLGVVLGVTAAVVYSGYILVGARLTAHAGTLPASAVVMAAAAVVYTGVAAVQRPALPTGAAGWAAVVALALVSTVVAITTFFAGVQRLGAADASTLSTLEPVVTVALAAAVLGERLAPVQLAGGALILAAVVVLARAPAQAGVPAPALRAPAPRAASGRGPDGRAHSAS